MTWGEEGVEVAAALMDGLGRNKRAGDRCRSAFTGRAIRA
jgi:hypothetical protein